MGTVRSRSRWVCGVSRAPSPIAVASCRRSPRVEMIAPAAPAMVGLSVVMSVSPPPGVSVT